MSAIKCCNMFNICKTYKLTYPIRNKQTTPWSPSHAMYPGAEQKISQGGAIWKKKKAKQNGSYVKMPKIPLNYKGFSKNFLGSWPAPPCSASACMSGFWFSPVCIKWMVRPSKKKKNNPNPNSKCRCEMMIGGQCMVCFRGWPGWKCNLSSSLMPR